MLRLYNEGDPCARAIYERAAGQLYGLAAAIRRSLRFAPGEPVRITYTGGVFRAGECILRPLRERVEAAGDVLTAPAFSPISGAVGYAARHHLSGDALEKLMREADRAGNPA